MRTDFLPSSVTLPPEGFAARTVLSEPAGDDSTHRYWRIYAFCSQSVANYCSVAEIQLRDTVSGADLTGSGTPSADSVGTGFEASKAVDDNVSTFWTTANAVFPHWWKYDFGVGAAYNIIELVITARNDTNYAWAPAVFQLEYSDDGTTWSIKGYSFVGTLWAQGSSQTFAFSVETAKVYTSYGCNPGSWRNEMVDTTFVAGGGGLLTNPGMSGGMRG